MKGQIEQQFDELIFLNKELQIVAPFKVEIVKNIRDILKEYDSMMISTKVSMSLLNTLMSDLMRITRKTGYWEYYCACKEVDITWNNFCSKENIYLKYPKLKDYCQKTINLFIGNVTIILKRINEDYHEICQLLDTIDLIKITSLNIGAGDSHFNGQRVAILEFNNKYKLVYKPRRSSGELLFNDFLKYINQNLSFNHPTYAVITKSDYSYTQFVNHIIARIRLNG